MKPHGKAVLLLLGCAFFASAAASCTPAAGEPLAELREIRAPAGPGSGQPNLSVGPDGAVYLTWLEQKESGTGAVHELRFSVLADSGWSAPRTIATSELFFANWADFPSLHVGAGRMTAHWLQRSGSGTYSYDVRVAWSDDGGATWTQGIVPHRDGVPEEHGFVSLFPVGDSLGIVWLDGRKFHERFGATREMQLAYTTLSPEGTLGAEVILDERICDCCQTSAAMTARGPIVVYRGRDHGEVRDVEIVRRTGDGWTAPQPVHRDGWVIAFCPVNGPSVDADGERAVVAWFTAARDSARVLVAFSDDAGASFGAPVRVDGGAPAGRVDVVLLDDGDALVTWIERLGGDTAQVQAAKVRRAGARSRVQPFTVARSSASRASGFPRMARSGDRVVFAWTVPGSPSRVRLATGLVHGK